RTAALHQRAGRDPRASDPRARRRAPRRSVDAHPHSAIERVDPGDAAGAPGASLSRLSRPVQLRVPGGDAAGDDRHPVQPAAGRRRRLPPVPGEPPARAFQAARSRAADLPAEEPLHAARLRGSRPVNYAIDLGARNIGSPFLWAGFLVGVVIVLAVDLKISARDQSSTFKEAVWWSVFWIILSVGFGFFVWFRYGGEQGLEYFAGYLLEKSLSVDNLFVVVRQGPALLATPLLLALIAAETTDLVFALDSIPAVFAVTDDPFLVFSSNICAVLGLRALYFVVRGALARLRYLKPGLAAILIFVGLKMLLYKWVELPTGTSLLIIAAILAIALLFSWLMPAPVDEQG